MTTRSGLAGIITGLVTTIVIYLLFSTWLDVTLVGGVTGTAHTAWITAAGSGILMLSGGFWAGRWSGSAQPSRCSALGALAGGLSGAIVFCLWGAAAAGLDSSVYEAGLQVGQAIIIGAVIRQTLGTFLVLFLAGIGLGAAGGWLACPRRPSREETFNKAEPQMAMNVSITAVLASVVAAVLAAAVFSRLAGFVGGQSGETAAVRTIAELPLAVSLLIVLISQFALMLVIPHEARQAEHVCGMDEVKMAAYVGIGAAPALVLLLFLVNRGCFANPWIITALLAIAAMSMKSLHSLLTLINPRRASFPPQQEGPQKTEAKWFGSIAASRGPRLAALCVGCGLVMVLPIYVSVLSVLINLASVQTRLALPASDPEGLRRLFLTQALVSSGTVTVSIITLITIYLFYLNLGRWFRKWNARRPV